MQGTSLDHPETGGQGQPEKSAPPGPTLQVPHQLVLPWVLEPFPQTESAEASLPLGWALTDSAESIPKCVFSPLLYHTAPLSWLQPIIWSVDISLCYNNVGVTDQSSLPPNWSSTEHFHDTIIAVLLLQEILCTPFWPGIDACVVPSGPRIASNVPPVEVLQMLHRNQATRPLEPRVPICRFGQPNALNYAAGIFEATVSYLLQNISPEELHSSRSSPWSMLTDEFINDHGTSLLSAIRNYLTVNQYIAPMGVFFEIPEGLPDVEKRLEQLKGGLYLLGLEETDDPLNAHIIIPLKPLDGLVNYDQENYINGGVCSKMMDGSLRSTVPLLSQSLAPDDSIIAVRPLDGGIVFQEAVYHAVGTPPSWDMARDGTLDDAARALPPAILPDSLSGVAPGHAIRLSESYLLASTECNELFNPADFREGTDAIRRWANEVEVLHQKIAASGTPSIAPELIGFIPEIAEVTPNYPPVTCWLDIAVGPSVAAPAHAQIVRFSNEVRLLCDTTDVATLVGTYAIPRLADAVGQSHKAQQIAQHLAQWLIFGLSNPTEHERIANATDPIATHAMIVKQAQASGTPSQVANIHPRVISQWRQQYQCLQKAMESMLAKIAGPQALEVLHQQQGMALQASPSATAPMGTTQAAPSGAQGYPMTQAHGGDPSMNRPIPQPGPPASGTSGVASTRIGPDYFNRMDSESRMMSLATLYLDVPRKTSDSFAPDINLQTAPVLPATDAKSDVTLPITIPSGMFPPLLDPRQHGDLKGVWGDSNCVGCPDALGPLVQLIDPLGTDSTISVRTLLEGQRRLVSPNEDSPPRPINERSDLCTLRVADWYQPGIISSTEWTEMRSLIGQEPTGSVKEAMDEYVEAFMSKNDTTQEEALRSLYSTMSSAKPQWREYLRVRDGIVRYYREDPKRYLTVSDCRRQIWGNDVSLMKVHAFLEFYGLINLQATLVPGGLKGTQFRPIARGISSYSTLRNRANLKTKAPKYCARFCEGCHKLKMHRVLRPRNTTSRAVWCVSCVASGKFPRSWCVEDFVPLELNPRGGSALRQLSRALENWTIDEFEVLTEGVEKRNANKDDADATDLLDVDFWSWISSRLKSGMETGDYSSGDEYLSSTPTSEASEAFAEALRHILNGEVFDPQACKAREPVYCLLAFLSSSRVTHL